MDKNRSQLADRSLHESFGSAEHRAVARDAVRKSLVLLKNDERDAAAREEAARIHVAGTSADDIGNQCGGWTIEWQGKSGDVTTGGTTILEAIKRHGRERHQSDLSPKTAPAPRAPTSASS